MMLLAYFTLFDQNTFMDTLLTAYMVCLKIRRFQLPLTCFREYSQVCFKIFNTPPPEPAAATSTVDLSVPTQLTAADTWQLLRVLDLTSFLFCSP